ncbi:MAG: adenosylcobinamide-GDP ribazoletransferase, partial [Proteobacteria bacterium]|nr:adenosylcobinamide-GDP ribazoletransferase [Pseudomonadota bacterium]
MKVALALLTRLPMGPHGDAEAPDIARAGRVMPLAGALIGLVGAAAFWLSGGLGLPPLVSGLVAVAATILFTGAFHEDGLADTVVPRLKDMGADVSMVRVLDAVLDHDNRQMLSLVTDIDIIEDALSREDNYKLLILDPINAYLGSVLDTHRDAPLRSVLAPLADLAERYSIAVAFILHLTKGQADRAIYRAQGNIAYVAAARVVHLVGVNPDDESERIIACIKNNLVKKPPAVAFTLNEGQFRWKGLTDIAPAALLKGDDDEEVRTGALGEAEDFLRQALAGGPRGAEATIKEATDVGIAKRTLMRAKAALKVSGKRFGETGVRGGGGWVWRLEPYDPGEPES